MKIITKKKLLAAGIAALLAPQAIAEVMHTEADSALLVGTNVTTVDENTPVNNTAWTPATTENNVVHVTSTPSGITTVYGGRCYASGCDTTNNTVIIDNASLSRLVGSGSAGTATGILSIYGGKAAEVNGAYSNASGAVTSNGTVNLYSGNAGTITGAIASSDGDTATANGVVNISGGTVTGNIYGASADSDNNAQAHSTVTIADNAIIEGSGNGSSPEIWGGYSSSSEADYDVFTGNTLNMSSAPFTVNKLGNFQYYNFAINDHNASVINNNNAALITVIYELANSGTVSHDIPLVNNRSQVKLTGISGASPVSTGDTITLIRLVSGASVTQEGNTTSLANFFDLTNSANTINVGLVKTANVSYSTSDVDGTVVATIGATSGSSADIDPTTTPATNTDPTTVSPERVQTNVKPLAEARVAALQNITRGADMLERALSSPASEAGSFTPLAMMDGGTTRYNSGSHVNSNDYRLAMGTRYQATDNVSAGLLAEYGRSNFSTYNGFTSGDVWGAGETDSYGVALLGRYSLPLGHDVIYAYGTLRAGRASTDYASGDIVTGSGTGASYKSRVNYAGGSLGMGYVFALSERYGLDTSASYLYSRVGSDSIVIDGDRVDFDASSSSRARLKEQLNYQATKRMTASLAGIYEYEFQGNANASAYGNGVDAPSVRGGTGIMELGFSTKPLESRPELGVDLMFRAYSGQREGASASAMVRYAF